MPMAGKYEKCSMCIVGNHERCELYVVPKRQRTSKDTDKCACQNDLCKRITIKWI